ncbi:hypothetical protein C5167_022983 [Papaver somniferum]|uniref:Uncharacterized protein n=1 Tax=Papaver somniferum TaxID=3469 RepID=A0A4Y7JN50_PAPSO|nr:hypothetical protein C5167_022983 [Papaver somniferum]
MAESLVDKVVAGNIENIIRALGLHKERAETIQCFSSDSLADVWTHLIRWCLQVPLAGGNGYMLLMHMQYSAQESGSSKPLRSYAE